MDLKKWASTKTKPANDNADITAAPIRVKSIVLTRAEGSGVEVNKPMTFSSFAQAAAKLKQWARTAPPGGAYDKCDFKVTWDDGQVYNGRYDLQQTSNGDLSTQVKNGLKARGLDQSKSSWKYSLE